MRHRCVSWLVLAALAVSACGGEDEDKEPIAIGLVAPKSGALDFIGDSFEGVAIAAVEEINARGGVNGHPLELIVKDSATDPEVAAMVVSELYDEGAVALVGPAISGSVEAAYPFARDNMMPMISPSSTAPSLSNIDDGGFMFRNVPNDNIQGIAIAYYLTQVSDPPVTSAAIIAEDSPYGDGLATAFQTAFERAGGTIIETVTFTQNEPSTDTAAADQVITALEGTGQPPMTVLVALEQDALAIAQAWDRSGALAGMEWFLTDGARSQGFLDGVPAAMAGMRGTSPTFPRLGDAYGELADAYGERYDDDLGSEVFAPNVWDGFHLIAAGLVAQDAAGQEFGGAGLRDAITGVSRQPGIILHAGQWRDMLATLNGGNDIDYDGAAGPNDFDALGEAVGPYEVWRIVDDGGETFAFEQLLFLEAREIQQLAEN